LTASLAYNTVSKYSFDKRTKYANKAVVVVFAQKKKTGHLKRISLTSSFIKKLSICRKKTKKSLKFCQSRK